MDALLIGFSTALLPYNLLYCFVGVFLGTAVGVLPGIGGMAAISMLLPVTFYLDPTTALIFLGGIYYGAEYGGSVASILLNLPGTPANAVTCIDGYQMARQGKAGVALFITTIGSFIGGCIGIIIMMVASPLVAAVALSFGPAEYFAIILIGLIASGSITQGAPIRGVIMVVVGVLLGFIGTDINTGAVRYSLGLYELRDGLHLVVLAMGLFGISEVIASAGVVRGVPFQKKIGLRSMLPSKEEWKRSLNPILRGTAVGAITGPLPGTGPSLSAFMAYALETKVLGHRVRFGKGAIEGVASPEAANNAAVQTAFIPTLTLGIPGTGTMAIMLGALMIHGIQPGPRLMTQMPELFWGVVASFWIGNVLLLVLNIPLISIWVAMLRIPYRLLYPTIICLICIGVFSINNSIFDVWLALAVGVFGYVLKQLEFEPAPVLMGFILGPMAEEHLRRALLLSGGNYLELFTRPISGGILLVGVAFIVYLIWSQTKAARRVRRDVLVEE